MTMVFCDSFDHYETADITRKWTGVDGSATIQTSAGRRGGGCLRLGNYNQYISKGVDPATTYTIGFAAKITTLASAGQLIAFRDTSTENVVFKVDSSGTITAYRNTTSLGSSDAGVVTAGGWIYLEFQATIGDSPNGSVYARVNGTQVIGLTGQDTLYTGSGVINNIRIWGNSATSDSDYDDLYINDANGSYNTGFLGDIRVDCYYPSGDGNSSQMVGSDGNSTSNYLLVDDNSATHGAGIDDDTTYVESDTSGNKDTYAFDDMSHDPVSIYAVQVSAMSRKTATGSRSLALVTRSNSTDYDSSGLALSDSYLVKSAIRERDPNGSIAWTKTNFNSAQFGIKIAS